MATASFQFLDVGMGDGTLIITPNKRLILVDFGEQHTPFKVAADDAMLYLEKTIGNASLERGLAQPTIDHLFLTHGDGDHYNKIPRLMASTNFKNYPGKKPVIRNLTFGGMPKDYGSSATNNLIEDLKPVVTNHVDDLGDCFRALVQQNGDVLPTWTYDDVDIYLLSSNFPKKTGKTNPKSLVLKFEYEGDKVILSGDAEKGVEEDIIDTYQSASDTRFLEAFAIKVGHHGSKKAASQAWLDVTNPDVAFASGDMFWAHPYCETLTRIIDHGTLSNISEHFYCCGQGSGQSREYFNHKLKKGVCLNLWYVVKQDTEDLRYGKKHAQTYVKGYTFGVQWALDLHSDKVPDVYSTDGPRPGALAEAGQGLWRLARPLVPVIQTGLV